MVLVASVIAVVGAGAGFGLQRALAGDDAALVDATVGSRTRDVPVHPCPGEPAVDGLHAGDRVLITGVHATDPAWLRIRDPRDPAVALWVAAGAVAPDGELTDLAEVECDPGAIEASPQVVASPSPSPSPSPSATPSPSTSPSPQAPRPGPTPTSAPSPTPTPTSTPTRGPTEQPTEQPTDEPTEDPTEEPAPIVFGSFDSEHDAIHPSPPDFSHNCSSPQTSEIGATVTHPSGIKSVTFHWTAAARGDAPVEHSGDRWSTVLHGFVEGEDDPGPIQVTVTATANDGTTDSTSWSGVTLLECT